MYRLFELYYFKDFLKIYKFLPEEKRICRIDRRVNDLRNTIYHHDQMLKYEKITNTRKLRESNGKILNQLTGDYDISEHDLRVIRKHAANNSVLVQINLLLVIKDFLTQSASTDTMYKQVVYQYSANINKASSNANETNDIQRWLTCYIKIVMIILDKEN